MPILAVAKKIRSPLQRASWSHEERSFVRQDMHTGGVQQREGLRGFEARGAHGKAKSRQQSARQRNHCALFCLE